MKILSIILILFLGLTGCKTMTGGGKVDDNGVSVKGLGDELESTITVTTRDYDTPFLGTISHKTADHFFRGYKNKETGEKIYQFYATVNNNEWAFWDEIRFNMNGSLKALEANRIAGDVSSCGYGVCALYEDVVVTIDETTLNDWATSPKPITVRFSSSRISTTIDTEVEPKEVKLFLEKMNSL